MTNEPVTAPGARRRMLFVSLLVSVVAICVAVPVVVAVTGPAVGGWDETVGFIAGLLVAGAGIVWALRYLAPIRR